MLQNCLKNVGVICLGNPLCFRYLRSVKIRHQCLHWFHAIIHRFEKKGRRLIDDYPLCKGKGTFLIIVKICWTGTCGDTITCFGFFVSTFNECKQFTNSNFQMYADLENHTIGGGGDHTTKRQRNLTLSFTAHWTAQTKQINNNKKQSCKMTLYMYIVWNVHIDSDFLRYELASIYM